MPARRGCALRSTPPDRAGAAARCLPRSRRPITTDPAEFDRDGDGLSDGAEAGARQTGPDGDDDDGITDPTKADTDGDGLNDLDEIEITGTDPKWGKVDQVFEEIVSPLDAAELQAVKIAQ